MSNKLYSKSDNWIDNKFHSYIQELKDMGIDGIEVYYPGYSHNTINTLLSICENQKLFAKIMTIFRNSNHLLLKEKYWCTNLLAPNQYFSTKISATDAEKREESKHNIKHNKKTPKKHQIT